MTLKPSLNWLLAEARAFVARFSGKLPSNAIADDTAMVNSRSTEASALGSENGSVLRFRTAVSFRARE